jgi:hypothetical protein
MWCTGIADEIQEVTEKILSAGRSSSSSSRSNHDRDRFEVLRHALASLQKKDAAEYFAFPLDTTYFTDYLHIVKTPMDFDTM